MNIVVLDGYTLNPGDLSWEPLQRLGRLTIYERTGPEQIVERARDAEIVLTNKTPLRAATLEQLPKLKYIGVLATGYDIIDVKAAAERGVIVTNVPDYSSRSVAQLTMALLLELCHHAGRHSDSVKAGDWAASRDFSYSLTPLIELSGKTMGIIGLGTIGKQTAKLAQAFGMEVIATKRSLPVGTTEDNVRIVELDELLRLSDVVSLHCPLTPETEEIIQRKTLDRMKPSAFLINTSRGKLVREQDLADALNEGRIAGAAVDVLSQEPPGSDHPLTKAANCILTPHIAWATQEARSRLLETAAANVAAFLAGTPVHTV
ncbi:D-2-hydroxyacid dehydrogenase [Paenibacillus sp. 32O-W]|uniref:D-2-hydroxyacid dehydrogenase n=1 Tax=Paenibacillus sp. 32O-W TaxID=1695218 RepID=UPI0011A676D2|nr:D-2-hydroxyacid dehydrogenase [Paenibacillus sp. 32O-W]